MKVNNPYRAFARIVYQNLTRLDYETVRSEQLVARTNLEAKYGSRRVPKEVSIFVRGNRAVIETKSLNASDETPNYSFPFVEALPKDEVVDAHISAVEKCGGKPKGEDVVCPDEVRDEDMVDRVYVALQYVLGMPDGETIFLD